MQDNKEASLARPASAGGAASDLDAVGAEIPWPVHRLFFMQVCFAFFLVLMHFFPERLSWTVHAKFALDGEANVPAWYSTILLFSTSVTALALYGSAHDRKESGSFWLFFGAVYCFLSLDEAAGLHEVIERATSVTWVVFYAPFAGIFFLACARHLVCANRKSLRNWILGGLVVYAVGGLIAELISYTLYPLPPSFQQLEIVLEEGLEMLGTIMVLRGCWQGLVLRMGGEGGLA